MHCDTARKMDLAVLCLAVLGMKYPVTCSTCFDMDSSLMQDSAMTDYIFDFMQPSTIYGCSSECLRSSTCKSFNFDLVTRTCQLNSNSSYHTNVVSIQDYVFSDIDLWPSTLSGPCAELQCQPGYRCKVNRLDRPACHQEFPGCGSPPPLIPNSEVEYDGHYIGAEAKYTCADDFLLCHKNTTNVCQSSTGRWEELTDLCGRFRFQNEGVVHFPCGQTSHFTATIKGMLTGERWR
ncbi:uncharacterized protein LOC124280578 isoform X2 [Haliotis rubra]|uniref:uncharacterized protein LOC124280578 isoform X2 n=1 Tax=Haliotis rubra TaxID=36100 RepID=UPI001EE57904|nr:uncharacterized protein LOC124280578 isoform X2 [Haliotis rubra]